MPDFVCDILESGAGRRQERISALNLDQAREAASRKFGIVLAVKPLKRSGFAALHERLRSKRLRQADIVDFCTVLAGYLEAGIPLRDALDLIAASHERLHDFASRTKLGASSGLPLDVAMQRAGFDLPVSLLPVVRAALASGTLPQTLRAEGEFMRKSSQIRTDMLTALAYPIVLFIVTIFVLGLLMLVVLPQIRSSFSLEVMQALPLVSRIVFAIGDALAAVTWPMLLAFLIILMLAGWFLRRKLGPLGEKLWLKVPLLGHALRHLHAATFCRSLGTLLKASVRAELAWRLAAETIGSRPIRHWLESKTERISAGEPISALIAQSSDRMPRDLAAITRLGERTGTLPEALIGTADRYSALGLATMQKLSAAAAPMVIVFLGLVIGFFAVGIMTAILSVNDVYGR